ncbi:hypothetical protein FSP39_016259 [Pinctada imbricata]|uniref:Uncharacterized protein n=1 Tax=Pinctada imbricata TaxID=66713 RepID=A0AA88YBX9_PINIB|nr:hypothetical protein FSP39_016259 [Pinctada imbricata]
MGCSIGSVRQTSEKQEDFKWKPEKTSRTASEKMTDDAIENSKCPLSKRQRFQIVKSWKAIARNIKDTGVNMFVSIGSTKQSEENTTSIKWKPDKLQKKPLENNTDDTVDRQNCPLSKRQRFQIVKSWKAISRNIKGTGVNMFVRSLTALVCAQTVHAFHILIFHFRALTSTAGAASQQGILTPPGHLFPPLAC